MSSPAPITNSEQDGETHVCHRCEELIEQEQFIRVGEFTFHLNHFTCWVCDGNLHEKKFHHRNNQFFCPKDFVEKFCHSCRHCNEKIMVGRVVQAFGGYYHPEHFVCEQCQNPFQDGKYFEYCNAPYCEGCFLSLTGEPCVKCGLHVADEDMVKVQNQPFHRNCLSCKHCGVSLGTTGSIFQRGSDVYCRNDYLNFFARRCTACGDHILKQCISVNDEFYHPHCLRCSLCSVGLSSYICTGGDLRCEEHSEDAPSQLVCSVCNEAIDPNDSPVLSCGKKVHEECFFCAYCHTQLFKQNARLRDGLLCCMSCVMSTRNPASPHPPQGSTSSTSLLTPSTSIDGSSSQYGGQQQGGGGVNQVSSPSPSLSPHIGGPHASHSSPGSHHTPHPHHPHHHQQQQQHHHHNSSNVPHMYQDNSYASQNSQSLSMNASFNQTDASGLPPPPSLSSEHSSTGPVAAPVPHGGSPLSSRPVASSGSPPIPNDPHANTFSALQRPLPTTGRHSMSPQVNHHRPAGSHRKTATWAGNERKTELDPNQAIEWTKGELIGKGAFGRVYMGMTKTGELIAVKQVRINTKEDEDHANSIKSEIKLMANLQHPNVVGLIGVEEVGEKLNILMEYVPGKSLHILLERFGAFDEELCKKYTYQMLDALQYCHANHIVHRDIKGRNILVNTQGVLKLADFGSAKQFDSKCYICVLFLSLLTSKLFSLSPLCISFSLFFGPIFSLSSHTIFFHFLFYSPGMMAKDAPSLTYNYTPLWTAPEVLIGNYDSKVDIWSVGCVIIEMATAKPPWSEEEFENPFRVLYHIGNSDAIPAIPSHFSEQGKAFVRRCLERDPDRRPSAAELLHDEWLGGVAADAQAAMMQ